MGGGGNPAGWASSISIDQEIKTFSRAARRPNAFGRSNGGVAVPDRADPWTRMSYAGGTNPSRRSMIRIRFEEGLWQNEGQGEPRQHSR